MTTETPPPALHSGSGGDLFAQWIIAMLVGAMLFLSVWGSLICWPACCWTNGKAIAGLHVVLSPGLVDRPRFLRRGAIPGVSRPADPPRRLGSGTDDAPKGPAWKGNWHDRLVRCGILLLCLPGDPLPQAMGVRTMGRASEPHQKTEMAAIARSTNPTWRPRCGRIGADRPRRIAPLDQLSLVQRPARQDPAGDGRTPPPKPPPRVPGGIASSPDCAGLVRVLAWMLWRW